MKKLANKKWYTYVQALFPVILLIAGILWTPLYSFEARVSDSLYSRLEGTKREIKIISVDEETLQAYGSFTNWSREKIADLITLLSQDESNAPNVIGMDFLFVSEVDESTDQRLVDACRKAGNVMFASNLVYRGDTKQDDAGNVYHDSWNVAMIEDTFPALKEVSTSGYANVHIAKDGCVRYTKLTESYLGETKNSFAYELYLEYVEATGQVPNVPKCDGRGKVEFFYSGESGEFTHYSMKSVLDGTVSPTEFKDAIVLVGAYAPGFQDSYISSAKRSVPMYGVEIHANVIQALMDGKTAVSVPLWLYGIAASLVLFQFFLYSKKQKLVPVVLWAAALSACHMVLGRLVALWGYTVPQLYFLLAVFFVLLYFIVDKYFYEKYKRKKAVSTLKRYMAPQIVDKLAKDGNYELKLGGEKRNIAVLFVDIRGFTSMSEHMEPEEVVAILNEYLSLTTSAVFANEGTLDKFIGDSTMAVFNAPFDLEDYVYKAILTALAIRDGSHQLAESLQKRFGNSISYGIGVNAGEAVVGNIGCETRMDYTAIGDTVNTAARLESKAKSGEILISEMVYDCVRDRVIAEPVGEMELKGKRVPVKVYQLIGLTGEMV